MLIRRAPPGSASPRPNDSTTHKAGEPAKVGHRSAAKQRHHSFPQDQVCAPDSFTLAPGEILFEEGSQSDCAYFIESGLIEVIHITGKVVTPVGLAEPGQILGEMGVIDRLPHAATARAKTKSTVRIVPAKVLDDIISRGDPAVQALIKTLISRLRDAIS